MNRMPSVWRYRLFLVLSAMNAALVLSNLSRDRYEMVGFALFFTAWCLFFVWLHRPEEKK